MPPLADQTDVRHQTLFLATLIVLAIGVVGCKRMSFKNNKEIPAKLRDVAPTTLRGKLHRAWGGDNFEVRKISCTIFCWSVSTALNRANRITTSRANIWSTSAPIVKSNWKLRVTTNTSVKSAMHGLPMPMEHA